MKMKRAAAMLLGALMLTLGITACGGSDNNARVDAQFSIGSKTSSVYANRFFDISFTLPDENWRILTEEEVALTVSATQAQLKDVASVKQALESGDTFFDLIALDQTTNAQVNVVITKVPSSMEDVTPEAVVDSGLAELGTALESMGASGIDGTRTTVNFQGETVPGADIRFTMSGMQVYEKQVALVKGSYVATVTVSSYGTDRTQELLDLITKN